MRGTRWGYDQVVRRIGGEGTRWGYDQVVRRLGAEDAGVG